MTVFMLIEDIGRLGQSIMAEIGSRIRATRVASRNTVGVRGLDIRCYNMLRIYVALQLKLCLDWLLRS